jgi:hypothetical protein
MPGISDFINIRINEKPHWARLKRSEVGHATARLGFDLPAERLHAPARLEENHGEQLRSDYEPTNEDRPTEAQ